LLLSVVVGWLCNAFPAKNKQQQDSNFLTVLLYCVAIYSRCCFNEQTLLCGFMFLAFERVFPPLVDVLALSQLCCVLIGDIQLCFVQCTVL